MRHNLKIEKKWLCEVLAGSKKAEIRRADRTFSVGDDLLLYTPDMSDAVLVKVTHIVTLDEVPGLEAAHGFVSLSIDEARRIEPYEIHEELSLGDFGPVRGR